MGVCVGSTLGARDENARLLVGENVGNLVACDGVGVGGAAHETQFELYMLSTHAQPCIWQSPRVDVVTNAHKFTSTNAL